MGRISASKDNLMPDAFLDATPEEIVKSHSINVIKQAKLSSAKTAASDSDMERIFQAITTNLSPELVSKVQAVYQFNVIGM